MEKLPGRTEGARKLPRNKGREKDPTKFQIRQAGNSLFRNGGIKKQQVNNERGSAAQMCEPKSAVTRLTVYDQAFKGRTKPHSESGVKSMSNRDVVVKEMQHSFDDQICKVQTNLAGPQQLVHQSENEAKCIDLISPVCRASNEKVYNSRLVPPRPAKDIILDNKAIVSSIMTAGKQNLLTQGKQKQDVAVGIANETPSSDREVAQKSSSAVEHSFENQEKDGNTCRDVSCSEVEVVPEIPALGANKINEFSSLTSVDSLKENEFVDKLAEIDVDGCDGPSSEDEDTKVLTDLVENEMVVSMDKASQSLIHRQQTLSENLESTLNEDKALKNEGDLSCSGISEDPSFVTKLKPSELYVFVPAKEAIIGETLGIPERLEHRRKKLVTEAAQIPEKIQEHPKCNDQTETPKSSTLSPFIPVEMLKDWTGLEKTIQSMLRGFVENQSFASEISRILPEVSGSLNQWISDFEETLKTVAENASEQHGSVYQESNAQMTGIKLTADGELPLEDLPEQSKTPEDPGSVEQSAAGHSAIIKEVTESSPEFSNSVNVEEEKQSQSDPVGMSCSEEFVFVDSYFAEPAETKMMESGLEQDLVDSPTNEAAEVVTKTNKQRQIVHRSQSCLVPVEVVETQLKRYRTLSSNSHVSQGSKVRRLIEITADEIKAMALPELVLMSLQEGRIFEDRWIDESTGSNTEDPEELSVGDMDSCEEVDEEAAQQPGTKQQRQPVTEVVVPLASSVKRLRGRKGFSLDSRKDKHKTDCKIS